MQENQARRLLNDIVAYRAHLEREVGATLPEAVAAYRWLTEVYEPITAAIPGDQRSKLELAETFHEVLEHRWFLSEAAGADVRGSAPVQSASRVSPAMFSTTFPVLRSDSTQRLASTIWSSR